MADYPDRAPCPRCGAAIDAPGWYQTYSMCVCNRCGLQGPKIAGTRARPAVEAWNSWVDSGPDLSAQPDLRELLAQAHAAGREGQPTGQAVPPATSAAASLLYSDLQAWRVQLYDLVQRRQLPTSMARVLAGDLQQVIERLGDYQAGANDEQKRA